MATHTDAEIDRAVAAFAAARRDPVMGADRG